MKALISTAVLAALLSMTSCASTEAVQTPVYLDETSSTPCLPEGRSADKNRYTANLEIDMAEDGAHCRFMGLTYSCDFGKVNISATVEDSRIVIVEYPDSDMADCLCTTNADFVLKNLTPGRYQLILYTATPEGRYDENQPYFDELIHLTSTSRLRLELDR